MEGKNRNILEKQFDVIHKCDKRVVILAIVFVLIIIIAIVVAIPKINDVFPQAIKVNSSIICYVKNETVAQKAVIGAYKMDLPKNARLIKASSSVEISIERANVFKAFSNIVSKAEAIKMINSSYTSQGKGNSELELSYIITHREDYIPDPILKKNKRMLAGRNKIKKKGTVGSMDVSTVYVSINGKIKNKKDINSTVIEKGVPAVVYRGTLGLPNGEDWKTYKGDPIYKDGGELIKTAYNYIGAPYKHGGTSLKTGVSCVGFVRAIYLKYGIKIGNSHRAMETAGIGVSYKNARKGDIICYRGHVGIYIGNGKMLDATSRRGVGVNTVHQKSIIAVRRIVK